MIAFLISNLPWFWLAILVLCLIIEGITMSLTTIWAAIAAVPFIFIAKTPIPFRWQLLIFVVITVVLIVFTRPFAVKKLNVGKENSTNVNALEGQEVLVVKKITPFEKGLAKSKNGVEWTAVSEESKEIEEGTICTIQKIEGNTLILKTKDQTYHHTLQENKGITDSV